MNDTLGAILRSPPACMCGAPAVVPLDEDVRVCDGCFEEICSRIISDLKFDPVTSESPSDVNVTAGAIRAPASAPAVTTSFDPMRGPPIPPDASANCDALAASRLSFEDPDMEAAVRSLEIEWLRVGIIMNSMTLRVVAQSEISSSAAA